jgi:GNAT superfamily N-acetyltransferase
MLQIKELDASARASYYNEKLVRDFPPDEAKPLEMIESLIAAGGYRFCGFFDGETPVGYACLMTIDGFTLLDYLAVEPALRGKGYGSQILPLILDTLLPAGNTLLIEAENPACATSLDDRAVRLRRLQFYKNGGMHLSEVLGNAFGVEYRIFTGGAARPDKEVADGLRAVYAAMLPPLLFQQNVRVWLA